MNKKSYKSDIGVLLSTSCTFFTNQFRSSFFRPVGSLEISKKGVGQGGLLTDKASQPMFLFIDVSTKKVFASSQNSLLKKSFVVINTHWGFPETIGVITNPATRAIRFTKVSFRKTKSRKET